MAQILELALYNFRNFVEQKIEFCPEFTFVSGQNASGKTSLLEAIYLLGRGKSFRTSAIYNCINHACERTTIRAKISNNMYYADPFWMGWQRARDGAVQYKVAENIEQKLSGFIKYLPVQFIDINTYKIIEEGPVFRREYLDWLLFHRCAQFSDIWQRMKKSLDQRNILLKSYPVDMVQVQLWTKSFVFHANIVDKLRKELVLELSAQLKPLIAQYYNVTSVEINYLQGWDEELFLEQSLAQGLRHDLMRKNTSFGPHKADLQILIDGYAVKEVFSRGQVKLLTCLMMQARASVLAVKSVFLIDDLSAELDFTHISKFLNALALLQCQVIITAIDARVAQILAPNVAHLEYSLQNSEILTLERL
jgi:DNA replication and repair protein RecF